MSVGKLEHDDCEWAESPLRLMVETGKEWMQAVFPVPPTMLPVQYCQKCGALRITPVMAEALTKRLSELEHERAEAETNKK